MIDLIIIIGLAAVLFAAARYIYKSKKSGAACIGCSACSGSHCSCGTSGTCSSCGNDSK